ncbi:MAG: hypothetical protein R3Y24_06385 [Eubacteriales bacterium]
MKKSLLLLDLKYHTEKKCKGSWKLDDEDIPFHDLTFAIKGKAIYHIDGKKYVLHAGEAIFLPEGSKREACTFVEEPLVCAAFNFSSLIEYSVKSGNHILPNKFEWSHNGNIKALLHDPHNR